MRRDAPERLRAVPAPEDIAARLFWPCLAGVAAALLLPFLAFQAPPLLDYPNHLARVHILARLGEDADLARYYEASWDVLPNLAFDLLGVALAQLLDTEVAGRVLVVTAVLGLLSGLVAVSAQLHGRPRLFCLVGSLFVFSQPFTYGFLNLMLGFGLALWGIALWLRLRSRPVTVLLAWSVPFALLLFLCHLFAFGSYAVALLGIELWHIGRARRRLPAFARAAGLGLAQAALPAALLALASPTSVGGNPFGYAELLPRLRAIALAPVRNYSDVVDLLTLATVAVVLAAGFWTGRLKVAREMRVALAILAPLSLLVPNHLASVWNAELRLPVILCLLFAASASWQGPSARAILAAGALFAALLGARTWVVMDRFAEGARFTAEVREALALLPRGVRIASVTVTTPEQHRMRPAWLHVVCYAVIDRSAFVPSIFAHPGQQPLRLGAAVREHAYPPERLVARPGEALDPAQLEHLDHLLVVNPGALRAPLPPGLEAVASGRDFVLYRVR